MTITAILHNFFTQHSPSATWIESEDRDDWFLNELNYITPNLNEIAGEQGVCHEQVLNY
jgi:hypothetical protein